MKPQYLLNLKDLQLLLVAAILQTQYFLDGGGSGGGLTLVVFQTVLLFVVGYGAQAESDFLFRFAHLNDLEIVLIAHVNWRFLGPAASGIARNFGKMAQAFHAFGELDKSSKTGQPAHAAMPHFAHLAALKVTLPCVGLPLIDTASN